MSSSWRHQDFDSIFIISIFSSLPTLNSDAFANVKYVGKRGQHFKIENIITLLIIVCHLQTSAMKDFAFCNFSAGKLSSDSGGGGIYIHTSEGAISE